MKFIIIGKIVNTHGIKGELRLLSSFKYKEKVFKKDMKIYIGKKKCEEMLEKHGWEVDVILTHTCPEKFEPREMFLDGLNPDLVDKSTEKWLDKIEKKTDYKLWYAGHYHADKIVNDKFKLMFTSVEEFAKELSKELQAETEHVEER